MRTLFAILVGVIVFAVFMTNVINDIPPSNDTGTAEMILNGIGYTLIAALVAIPSGIAGIVAYYVARLVTPMKKE